MHYKRYKTILSSKNSMNIYRGCTHGCIYCDSRSKCYRMEHDFEDIEVKEDAHIILEAELKLKRKKCMIGTGAMSDPYNPLEVDLQSMRRCLKVIDRYGFGVAIQTKSDRILRDLDLLKSINAQSKCVVQMTLTTFDETLCRIIEPNVCTTAQRVDVLHIMRQNAIPTVVWLTPLLPFINDTERNLRGLLDYCIEAKVVGVLNFGMGVTLRQGDREYFYRKLDRHFPGLKNKYKKKYGDRYIITSDHHDALMQIFHTLCTRHGILCDNRAIFAYMRQYTKKQAFEQMKLF